MTLKDESPRLEGVQYATQKKWERTTNGPRKNDVAGAKRKHCSFKMPWRRERLPTPVFWPGEFHGCIVHGVAKSWTRLSHFHFHW